MSAQPQAIFLTEGQVDELTGILRGRGEKSKLALQAEFLRNSGIVHFVNARGRPIVPISAVEGRQVQPVKPRWQPKIA